MKINKETNLKYLVKLTVCCLQHRYESGISLVI